MDMNSVWSKKGKDSQPTGQEGKNRAGGFASLSKTIFITL